MAKVGKVPVFVVHSVLAFIDRTSAEKAAKILTEDLDLATKIEEVMVDVEIINHGDIKQAYVYQGDEEVQKDNKERGELKTDE